MAQNNDSNEKNVSRSRTLNHELDLLSQKMDSLYKDIYISRPDNKENLDKIIDNIDDVLDKLQGSDSVILAADESEPCSLSKTSSILSMIF